MSLGGRHAASNTPVNSELRYCDLDRYLQSCLTETLLLAVLKTIFDFILSPPSPRGVPGEGPDCHFLRKSEVLG